MLFQTWTFALFFLIVFPVYLAIRRTRAATLWLLVSSYVFYGWWNPFYLLLIVYATAVNYFAVARMDRGKRRKLWLAVSIANNLALLGFFKYATFIAQNVNLGLRCAGIAFSLPEQHDFLLPVGISFYTFQAMSYTIDYYRGRIEGEGSFIRFAAFVSFFPQLVAGPIERAKALLPQIQERRAVTENDMTDGLSLFVVGLFKKVALADYLALYVDPIYRVPDRHGAAALLLATVAFAWQIYFDFSGYTDMARGVARMMGFRLMLNFNNPYLATGLGDFWSRWHISLSTWFRDYVYIPLGGNRKGEARTYFNIFATIVLSGLWHGAAWTFAIWGVVHAMGCLVTRSLERSTFYKERVPKLLKQVAVFAFVCFAWIFFRAESFHDACVVISRMVTGAWTDPAMPVPMLGLVTAVWLYQFVCESNARKLLAYSPVRIGLAAAMVLYVFTIPGTASKAFIYFQF